MSGAAARALFALVESFFTEYLKRQRGASEHTVRAYRDALKLLLEFVAQRRSRDVASLEPKDLDAEMIAAFLDHLETARSNAATTRNCRRAAIRSFFRHLVRNDLAHRGSTLNPDFRAFSESDSSSGAGLKAMIAKVLWWHVCNSHRQT